MYFVKRVEKCPLCEGSGTIQHPAWEAYWKANPKGLRDEAADKRWFEENWLEWSPEEIVCPECYGEGEVEEWVDLAEALQALGDDNA